MSGALSPQFLAALQMMQGTQPQPTAGMPAAPMQAPQGATPWANYLGGADPSMVPAPAPQPQPVAAAMPQTGYLPGKMYLDPTLAPTVPSGAARPFAPGEYVRNPDGGWSSEISMTVEHPDMNNGQPTVIPSLWIANGKPYRAADEDEAVSLAQQSKLPFPSFGSMDAADQFANKREDSWQKIDAADPTAARTIAPLWKFPQGASQ